MMIDNTHRFSNRVEDYAKHRPAYPEVIVPYMEQNGFLQKNTVIADIGSGTGISSMLFLNAGYVVTGVEPNKQMRDKSSELLKQFKTFKAVNGTAEYTTLPAASVGLIVAGQAFHWFDRDKARTEFERILQPGAVVALMWNERLIETSFERELETFINKHNQEYKPIKHRNIGYRDIEAFFKPYKVMQAFFEYQQDFNYVGLEGRLLSSSYSPSKTDAGYAAMTIDLRRLFDTFQEAGQVSFRYATKLFVSRMALL